jgi:hypothetical protein
MDINRFAEVGKAPGGAGMIEMDVAEENVPNVVRQKAKMSKLGGKILKGGFRADIKKNEARGSFESSRGDDPGATELPGIENVDHVATTCASSSAKMMDR